MFNFKEILIYALTASLLSVIYFSCFNVAEKGYGYSGYRGFHHHHYFWYYRNTNENYSQSVRENSKSGHNFSKRGINGGK